MTFKWKIKIRYVIREVWHLNEKNRINVYQQRYDIGEIRINVVVRRNMTFKWKIRMNVIINGSMTFGWKIRINDVINRIWLIYSKLQKKV